MKKLISQIRIKNYCKKIAAAIEEDYVVTHNRPLVLVGVMNGGLPFLVGLGQQFDSDLDIVIDTVQCGSYTGIFQKGKFKITKMPDNDLSNSFIVIVDDIVDTGETMTKLVKTFQSKYPNSIIKTCSLLKRANTDYHVDYIGRPIKEGLWLVGFGLDDNGIKRNLKDIYVK
jgi:hypoxanthine phosphoribosyltransferase